MIKRQEEEENVRHATFMWKHAYAVNSESKNIYRNAYHMSKNS